MYQLLYRHFGTGSCSINKFRGGYKVTRNA